MRTHNIELCREYIRVIQMPYVADCDVKHRNCDGLNKECEGYRPYYKGTEEPYRRGRLAFLVEVIN